MTTTSDRAPDPVLVRGTDFVVGPDGVAHRAERPVVALCRCGASGRAPWCDSTHKLIRQRRPSRAASDSEEEGGR